MEYFIGTVLLWAPTFAPRGWSYCNGGLLAISQNTALFSLIGTTYGGDGRTTFGLPDLRSRVPIGAGMGQGPGLSFYPLGARAGVESVTLLLTQMPQHNHPAQASMVAYDTPASDVSPQAGQVLSSGSVNVRGSAGTASIYANPAGAAVTLAPQSTSVQVGMNGGNQSHENRMPFEGVSFIIALTGIFPPRD
ncbi:phage tail protein [Salinarimonas ramus]|uniref:phage tail protein n=1 Tax=Salinarimonas ramus TaxID=690164 RepID=UPI00166DE825|nr:tail fiber protein [Salinarimonas ramus]